MSIVISHDIQNPITGIKACFEKNDIPTSCSYRIIDAAYRDTLEVNPLSVL